MLRIYCIYLAESHEEVALLTYYYHLCCSSILSSFACTFDLKQQVRRIVQWSDQVAADSTHKHWCFADGWRSQSSRAEVGFDLMDSAAGLGLPALWKMSPPSFLA